MTDDQDGRPPHLRTIAPPDSILRLLDDRSSPERFASRPDRSHPSAGEVGPHVDSQRFRATPDAYYYA